MGQEGFPISLALLFGAAIIGGVLLVATIAAAMILA